MMICPDRLTEAKKSVMEDTDGIQGVWEVLEFIDTTRAHAMLSQ